MAPTLPAHVQVAIVGSGFAGLGAAIRLKQQGFDDFVVLERAGDIGGTWRDNAYPGCACDVESVLYSFSFAPNPNWSHFYSPQPEILEYLRGVARRYGILPHVRYHQEVREAHWDERREHWRIETSQGHLTADVLVAGFGALSEPAVAELPGLARFEGKRFHSAQWDPDYDLHGKRVGVVGTGASAIQIVPAIQPEVARLSLFQRTPPWILPRHDRPLSEWEHFLFNHVPLAQALSRAWVYFYRELYVFGFRDPKVMAWAEAQARRHLARAVPDPALRAKLTPTYTFGCKRVLLSDDYYPALTQPNVEVVTAGIREVTPHGIVTADGTQHPLDALVMATGFRATDPTFARFIYGRGGVRLRDAWQGSPKAYLGTTVAGFPNLFLLFGPNSGLGHTSVVLMLESQLTHLVRALAHMRRRGLHTIEVRPEAQAAWVAEVDQMAEGTVWTAGHCKSWYLDETGRNSTLWPGFTAGYRHRVEHFDPYAYRLAPAQSPVEAGIAS